LDDEMGDRALVTNGANIIMIPSHFMMDMVMMMMMMMTFHFLVE
jgi:hypothetical protein